MFYVWLRIAFAVLLCAALWLNRGCWRSFTLTLAVGACIFVPVPWVEPVSLWYFKQALNEMLVIGVAIALRGARAAMALIIFSALLVLVNLIGAVVGPVSGIGPYRVTVPMLETGKLLVCILLSHAAQQKYEQRALRAILERHSHD